jgi:RNA polymerase sigma factor (sigma-70 family)
MQETVSSEFNAGRTSRWAEELRRLSVELAAGASIRQRLRGSLWVLVNGAVRGYLHMHSRRLGRISIEDLEDIAADKSLDLLAKMDNQRWRPDSLKSSEIEAYLSAVARNGLIDHLREKGRWSRMSSDREFSAESGAEPESSVQAVQEAGVESREFARSLRECAQLLSEKSRIIWFFRIFYGLASKRIAAHPEVRLKPGNVDVNLKRSREKIKECMRKKGFEVGEIPAGTFAELWETFRRGTDYKLAGEHDARETR